MEACVYELVCVGVEGVGGGGGGGRSVEVNGITFWIECLQQPFAKLVNPYLWHKILGDLVYSITFTSLLNTFISILCETLMP